jgi:hypothetical protein
MKTETVKKPIYDLDITKPIPVLVEELRADLTQVRGKLQDIGYCLGWKDRFEDVIGLLTCGIVVLHGVKTEIAQAESKAREQEEKNGKLPKSYGVSSRGVGADFTPGCFVCGGDHTIHANISMFVESKEDGEAIVALFKTGARLDYRDFEPEWIQVKVGACNQHLDNLKLLNKKVNAYPYRISAPMIQEAVEGK